MRAWTVSDIVDDLVVSGENDRYEAKSGLRDAVMATVSAFSNTVGMDGGWIVFGLAEHDDGTLAVRGVPSSDRLQTDLQSQLHSALSHTVTPEVACESIDGKRIVVAYIPEADASDKPVFVRKQGLAKGAFLRVGSTDAVATAPERLRWASLAQSILLESRPAPMATLDDLDSGAAQAYRHQLRDVRPSSPLLDLADSDLYEALGAVTPDGQPTMLGLWLFGTPLACVACYPFTASMCSSPTGPP